MADFKDLLILVAAFLLGAMPFAVIISKVFFKTDVRNHGSGNPGATNTLRTLGPAAGIFVLLLDIGKGVFAVFMANLLHGFPQQTILELQTITGTLAILGHIFSPFLMFKGGKGVATTIGTFTALMPALGLVAIVLFLLILLFTRFVSVASMVAIWSFPLCLLMFYNDSPLAAAITALIALLVTIRHKENIIRLADAKENRFSWPGSRTK